MSYPEPEGTTESKKLTTTEKLLIAILAVVTIHFCVWINNLQSSPQEPINERRGGYGNPKHHLVKIVGITSHGWDGCFWVETIDKQRFAIASRHINGKIGDEFNIKADLLEDYVPTNNSYDPYEQAYNKWKLSSDRYAAIISKHKIDKPNDD